jgi:superfamily I DNA/RNA helicase
MEASLQPLRDNGGGDPETFAPIPVRDGPNPKLIPCASIDDQIKQTAQFLKDSSKETRLPVYAGAVLVRSNRAGEEFAAGLNNKGLEAELVRGPTFNLDEKIIKVMTIHSAKGLEFPFVAVVRVDDGLMPFIHDIKDDDERKARLEDERRLLSVGMSRAMRRLALVFDKNRLSYLIKEIDVSLWN